MKIQIDTVAKTIKLESCENLGVFIDTVQKLLPDGEWKSYKIDAHTTINNWGSPIYIDRYEPNWWGSPMYRSGAPFIGATCKSSLSASTDMVTSSRETANQLSGILNYECN